MLKRLKSYQAIKPDHSLILLKLNFGKFQKGRSYWKLKDNSYVMEIKKVIELTKFLYANENQMNYSDIAEVSLNEIQFIYEDGLFFDVLLMEIRGKTISYSSYKKKKRILIKKLNYWKNFKDCKRRKILTFIYQNTNGKIYTTLHK